MLALNSNVGFEFNSTREHVYPWKLDKLLVANTIA